MQHLKNLWLSLDTRKQVIAVLGGLAVVATLFAIFQIATKPSMSLLYSGLEDRASGDVMQALEAKGVVHEIRGDSIFVETSRRDALRMSLASEGLPGMSSTGYEVLDGLNGFGTTSQMFDAAYWRAKEGELARTILASPMISSARVHIATSLRRTAFNDSEPSASVSVITAGGDLPARHAKALKYLVASAVAGLTPENVAIVDGQGGVIDDSDSSNATSLADQRAEILRGRVQNLLEARVGHGNAVVEVSIETITESESIHQKQIDPDSRVVISTDSEETVNRSTNADTAAVGVASNLPDGDADAQQNSERNENRTRERINYEISETERRIVREPGAVKRLTVAVLVNSALGPDAAAEPGNPQRSDAELANLRELVASAVGYDEQRGDMITIKAMEFEAPGAPGTGSAPSLIDAWGIDVMSLVKLVILALTVLATALLVLRPILKGARQDTGALTAPPTLPGLDGSARQEARMDALTGEIDDTPRNTERMELVPSTRTDPGDALAERSGEDPVGRLRTMIEERKEETVEILRNWLEPKEEDA
ncbi:flagellar basal-body MS-ring/collar protein FliF [Aquicoccus sp.]|uniref:flagellar basal-body MS-ring/collar protein FliF n=1 Tax=Aquicoccus sp. TaxID=2055851 RepID=UPI003568F2E6